MAENNTVFFLDEEPEDDLGGFNDPIVVPEEDPKPDEEESEEEEVIIPEEEPEPEVNPFEQKFNEAMGLVTSQSEQIKTLVEQNKQMQEKPKPDAPQAPEKPVFTQEQWDDDAQACSDANLQYHDDLRVFNEGLEQTQATEQANAEQTNLQASHAESWNLSTIVIPELVGNEKARQSWNAIFRDPAGGLVNDPNGPLKATQILQNYMAKNKLSFEDKPEPKPDLEAERIKGAEDEAARQKRIANNESHGNQSSGDKKTVHLTMEQKAVCRKMNVTEEAYAKTLSAMGRS